MLKNKNYIKLILIGLVTLFLHMSTNAHAESIKSQKLTIEESQQLLDDVQYLLSDKETVDYDDPRLNEILDKYDYKLFKAYKAFIEFDKSDKTKEDIVRAKNIILNYFNQLERYASWAKDDLDEKK